MPTPAPILYQGADDILQALGIAPTSVNVNLLVAQEINEWGWSGADLQQSRNPLATTLWTPDAVGDWNTLRDSQHRVVGHVYIYSTLQAGGVACAKTLQAYPVMLQALKTSNPSGYFGSAGRAELYRWSGGSAGYAGDLQTFYGQLQPVPSAYLAKVATKPKPIVSTFYGRASYAPWAILTLGALAAGAVALEETGALRRLRGRL